MKDGIRVTRAVINLDNLRFNLGEARKRIKSAKIMAVVKGNAYGHGMVGVSRFLEREGVDFLGVALLEEAVELRKAGIKIPVLVMSSIQDEEAEEAVRNSFRVNLCRYELAERLNEAAMETGKKALVHIKVDIGQVRYGILPEEIPDFVSKVSMLKGISIEGIFSYMPNEETLKIFVDKVKSLEEKGISIPLRHVASSAALFKDFTDSYLDMVRVGQFLHGSGSLARQQGTVPVFSLKSAVAFSKTILPGTFSVPGQEDIKKPLNIAIAAVGYGDGIPKALAGKGNVLIRGKRFPIRAIGMDSLIIDTGDEKIGAGEEVFIVGSQGEEEIKAYDVAKTLSIGVNQFTGRVATRVPRVFFEKGKFYTV